MRLKALEMQGFKSFADRTTIEFGDGITGIVGPNGSGKSNISDAVRWVIGEQRAKQLRGGNMQDVIFAGTQKRKPLGFAEVTLIIDNSDRKLDIDFDEVAVTRRLFRSGESEYYINKSTVRLKDVSELFMDTGIGKDGYSIISQGKIAEILSNKPEDRRQMFEEASGISKYRYRKEEASRKLEHTTENLLRVNDIITEIEDRIEPLKNQSEKAKKYLLLRDKLRVLDVSMSLHNIETNKVAIKKIDDVYDDLKSQIEEVTKKVDDTETNMNKIFDSMSDCDTSLQEKRENLENANKELADCKSEIAILFNKIENNEESISRIKSEITELNNKNIDIEKNGQANVLNYEKVKALYEELKEKIDKKHLNLNELEKQLNDGVLENDKFNSELIDKMNEIADLKYKISSLSALKTTLNDRLTKIDDEMKNRNKDFSTLEEKVLALSEKLTQKKSDMEEVNNLFFRVNSEFEQKKNEIANITKKMQEANNNYSFAKSRLKLLRDLENSFDNYSKSVKAVMKGYQNKQISNTNILGTVAQAFSVNTKYSVAIEVALGGSAQNIITENEQDAKNAIEFLKSTKQGRVTFLPLSACKNKIINDNEYKNQPGFIGIAANLVNFDKKFLGVASQLLGRTIIIDNIDNAVSMAKKFKYSLRIVTLDGEYFAPGGSISGGSKNHAGVFSRANELAELEKNIGNYEKSIKIANEEYEKQTLELKFYSEKIETASSKQKALNDELITLESEVKHSNEFLSSVKQAKEQLENEKKQIKIQFNDIDKNKQQNNEIIDSLQAKIDLLKQQLVLKKDVISNIEKQKNDLTEDIMNENIKLNDIKKDIEIHNEKLEMDNERKHETELSVERKNENILEINEIINDLKEDIEFKNQQISDYKDDIINIKTDIDNMEQERTTRQQKIKTLQDSLKTTRDEQFALQSEQSRLDNKKVKAEADLEIIVTRLWEDYELTLTTANEVRTEINNISEAVKEIKSLKADIKNLGNVNVDSIEEYKQTKERYDFLTNQRDDLAKAKTDLESVIVEMLDIMRLQFNERFKTISKNFSEIFKELFGGGSGELKLTDPNDVLASGVDIIVNPPGKSIKSIMQLSGGEQAMVSIALLFAILKVRPSPFCILDEIEAALDDVNVYRFADFLKKNLGQTQYIVVTHRRGTMESANVLYGVTMQEKGVTKLLSINIDDIVNMNK